MMVSLASYRSLLGYILFFAFGMAAVVSGTFEFSDRSNFDCDAAYNAENLTSSRRLEASLIVDTSDPWIGVGSESNLTDFESMMIDAQGDPSAFFVGNLGLAFVAMLACTFIHYVMYGLAHPSNPRRSDSMHHIISKKIVSKHSFPRWELSLLILLYNGLSESARASSLQTPTTSKAWPLF